MNRSFKSITLAATTLAGMALSATTAQAVTLYDNGPVVDGAGLSVLTPLGGAFGFTSSTALNFTLADNFSIVGANWNVQSLDFFAYQTGSAGFTFTTVTWSILSGNSVNTATPIASGTTAVTDGGFVGHRVFHTDLTATNRAIWRINADITDVNLAAGDYFVTWGLAGTGNSGPFVSPVEGSLGTGDGLQSDGGPFALLQAGGTVENSDLPFAINGFVDSSVVPEPSTWLMMMAGFGLVGAGLRRRQTMARLAI